MNNSITLIVADDHPLLLSGLVGQLKDYNYEILGTAENGARALELIREVKPSIAILDEEMPLLTGFEVIKKCQELALKTKFIILSSHKEKSFIYKAQKLNISGYIIKDEPFKELHNCIQSVNKGTPYFSSIFSSVLENEIAPQVQKMKLLSPSERTIVRLIGQGKTSKDIAELLTLSPRTIDKHRSNIITKLNLVGENSTLSTWVKQNLEFLI
jgi:DNA-binding NarL/FixJ family response regulator